MERQPGNEARSRRENEGSRDKGAVRKRGTGPEESGEFGVKSSELKRGGVAGGREGVLGLRHVLSGAGGSHSLAGV